MGNDYGGVIYDWLNVYVCLSVCPFVYGSNIQQWMEEGYSFFWGEVNGQKQNQLKQNQPTNQPIITDAEREYYYYFHSLSLFLTTPFSPN